MASSTILTFYFLLGLPPAIPPIIVQILPEVGQLTGSSGLEGGFDRHGGASIASHFL